MLFIVQAAADCRPVSATAGGAVDALHAVTDACLRKNCEALFAGRASQQAACRGVSRAGSFLPKMSLGTLHAEGTLLLSALQAALCGGGAVDRSGCGCVPCSGAAPHVLRPVLPLKACNWFSIGCTLQRSLGRGRSRHPPCSGTPCRKFTATLCQQHSLLVQNALCGGGKIGRDDRLLPAAARRRNRRRRPGSHRWTGGCQVNMLCRRIGVLKGTQSKETSFKYP